MSPRPGPPLSPKPRKLRPAIGWLGGAALAAISATVLLDAFGTTTIKSGAGANAIQLGASEALAGEAKTGLGNPTYWPPTDNPMRVDPRKRFLHGIPPPFRFWCTSVEHVPIKCVRLRLPGGPREKCTIPPNKLKLTCFAQSWDDPPPVTPPD